MCTKSWYRRLALLLVVVLCFSLPLQASAHSGRTDSNGGHRDNKNVSGLGSYHYHCGGNPPHLHTNGVCPYSSGSSTKTNTSTGSSTSKSSTSSKASMKLSKSSLTLLKGKSKTLKVSGTSDKVTWSSSDKKIATVNQSGKVTAVAKGSQSRFCKEDLQSKGRGAKAKQKQVDLKAGRGIYIEGFRYKAGSGMEQQQ